MEKELAIVFEIMVSPFFIFLDLLFFSLILTFSLYSIHQSMLIALFVFSAACLLFSGFFLFINKIMSEKPD